MVKIIEPIPFLRSLGRSLHQLLQLMTGLRSGIPQREALQKAGVFFKDEPLFLAGLKKWNFKDLVGHVELMQTLEHDVKFKALTPSQVHYQCLRAITDPARG